jgi:hypothetical protein
MTSGVPAGGGTPVTTSSTSGAVESGFAVTTSASRPAAQTTPARTAVERSTSPSSRRATSGTAADPRHDERQQPAVERGLPVLVEPDVAEEHGRPVPSAIVSTTPSQLVVAPPTRRTTAATTPKVKTYRSSAPIPGGA